MHYRINLNTTRGGIKALQDEGQRRTEGAFQLLRALLGFPQTLFKLAAGGIACTAPEDPLVKVFYRPVSDETSGAG